MMQLDVDVLFTSFQFATDIEEQIACSFNNMTNSQFDIGTKSR